MSLWPSKAETRRVVTGMIKQTDILRLNSDEAKFLMDTRSIDGAMTRLLRRGPRLVVVTDGSNGCFFATRTAGGHVPGFRDKAVDTTGCGDGFLAGLLTGIISGRESDATLRRAEELEMTEIHQQVPGKESAYLEIVERLGLSDEQVCYIGDDLVDIPVMKRVGLPAAPGDAHPCILPYAVLLAAAPGGRGAVREVVDRILRAQGRWHEVTEPYL